MKSCCGWCPGATYVENCKGNSLPHHLIEISLMAIAASGSFTVIAPTDYRAIGVAAIGAIIGGLLAARLLRKTLKDESMEWIWGVSTLASIAFSPALFDVLSTPLVVDEVVKQAAVIPRSASMMLALSTAVAISGWGILAFIQVAVIGTIRNWCEKLGILPPSKKDDQPK